METQAISEDIGALGWPKGGAKGAFKLPFSDKIASFMNAVKLSFLLTAPRDQ